MVLINARYIFLSAVPVNPCPCFTQLLGSKSLGRSFDTEGSQLAMRFPDGPAGTCEGLIVYMDMDGREVCSLQVTLNEVGWLGQALKTKTTGRTTTIWLSLAI